ncbi:SH3 domain-containing protein [Streptomyces griseoloalbus]|uniref:SH3 domain-containing protein n=1 Tax=Streptomyces griseoloalbus TaxID=67303 RepID=UPI00339DC756
MTAGPVAQAAQDVVPSHAAGQQAHVCTVNADRANFRGGPGTEYPVLGQVDRGQQFVYRAESGEWFMGDLVGGRTGV